MMAGDYVVPPQCYMAVTLSRVHILINIPLVNMILLSINDDTLIEIAIYVPV